MKSKLIIVLAGTMILSSILVLLAEPVVFQHRLSPDRAVTQRVWELIRRARPDLQIKSATFKGTKPDFVVGVEVVNRGLVAYQPDTRENYRPVVALWHLVGNDLTRLADTAQIPALDKGESATVTMQISMPSEGVARALIQWDADPRNDTADLYWIY